MFMPLDVLKKTFQDRCVRAYKPNEGNPTGPIKHAASSTMELHKAQKEDDVVCLIGSLNSAAF